MVEPCPICEDSGVVMVERDGSRVAQTCGCRVLRKIERMILKAKIPKRHEHCALETYSPGKNRSFVSALLRAHKFVTEYPVWTDGVGLLLVGGFGVGKTHLAVGILRDLIAKKAVDGLFCDYRSLLKQIQDSYGRPDVSERQVLSPIFDAEILVIDELGAAKPTEWVWDTVQHILNTRYNDRKTTIITTNYRNERELPMGYWDDMPKDQRDAVKAMYRDNLGDRITERMRSRLLEMCVVVEMDGPDYRETKGKAKFGGKRNGRSLAENFATASSESSALTELALNSMLESFSSELVKAEEIMPAAFEIKEERPVLGRERLGKFAAPFREQKD